MWTRAAARSVAPNRRTGSYENGNLWDKSRWGGSIPLGGRMKVDLLDGKGMVKHIFDYHFTFFIFHFHFYILGGASQWMA